MFPHLLGFEFRVEDGQLCEHAHVSTLQAQGSLQHGDQLLEVTAVLRDADKDAGRRDSMRSVLWTLIIMMFLLITVS